MMNVDVRLSTSRAFFLFAAVLLLAAAGPANADEICFGSGIDFVFHLNASTSPTSVGNVVTLVGLLRSNVAGTITLDPVTGTAVTEDATGGAFGPGVVTDVRVSLIRPASVILVFSETGTVPTASAGTTIYNARLIQGGFGDGYLWWGSATVDRLPQGTTLFPQTTISFFFIADCATGFARKFH